MASNTNEKKIFNLIIAVAVSVILITQIFFTVDQKQQAIVLQFGDPVNVIQEPGLKVKIPFIQNVRYFDKRILNVDLPPERVNLSSGQRLSGAEDEIIDTGGEPVIIDTFARVRITDPLLFLERLDTIRNAEARIQSLMNSATRDILGQSSLQDILSPVRMTIMQNIRDRLNAEMESRGVEVVDVRIVRADLTERMQGSTINRMISGRREQATDIRAKGEEKAAQIRAEADRQRTVIIANANRQSQIFRGEGDRIAIKTYADAFNKDPSFYSFIRSMEAYKNVFSKGGSQFVLSPDQQFLRHMDR